MVEPHRAAVEPRAFSPRSGDPLPLVDLLEPLIVEGARGAVALCGPPGAGKTAALAHLAAADLPIALLDEPSAEEVTAQLQKSLVVYGAESPLDVEHLERLRIAGWRQGDCIEYLLARHPERCKSVMARIEPADFGWLGESPELWIAVLEQMARDPRIANVRPALRKHLAATMPDLGAERSRAYRDIVIHDEVSATRLVLAADFIAEDQSGKRLRRRLPLELIRELALLGDPHHRFRRVAEGWYPPGQPMAASVLHAMKVDWRPPPNRPANLHHAYLQRVDWPEAQLNLAMLAQADLRRANLRGARLSGANLKQARLSSADLRGADLQSAYLAGPKISGADFRGARLDSAELSRLDMQKAQWHGASFRTTRFHSVLMEFLELPDADFHNAIFDGCYLTAAEMPRGNFKFAELARCALADINLEGANLHGANLRGVTFHMGSSRSGRVPSGPAMEGSMTGFYTDDYSDKDFKPPEQIRKANLRGVDLTGADIENVDFYLVDLRDAKYDPEQRDQLVKTGAIL